MLSQREKFRKVDQVMQKLALLASEVSMKEFNVRLACLEEITKIWERGDYLYVTECFDDEEGMDYLHNFEN